MKNKIMPLLLGLIAFMAMGSLTGCADHLDTLTDQPQKDSESYLKWYNEGKKAGKESAF